jgi:Uma2 family endonuclease
MATTTLTPPPAVFYPDSDGEPIAENTLQFEWIATLKGNFDLLFRDDPNVFVAGDHLIYPVEGDAETRQAPDVYVAFGRPKGHRGSYKVFAEQGVFPQVIFEVWSPGNTAERMDEKRKFYEKYGAEEYYIVYPDFPAYCQGWRRAGDALVRIENMNGHVSPRLGIRFEVGGGELAVTNPAGGPLLSFVELGTLQEETAARANRLAARLRELGVDPDAV